MDNAILILFCIAIITIIILSVHIGIKQCCGGGMKTYKWSEGYILPITGTDEGDAEALQRYYLPPSDDLTESGGSYLMLAGNGPQLSPQQDPWIDPHSFLN